MIGQVLEQPEKLRFKKPCVKCGKMFRPTGRATCVCDECKKKNNWRKR